MEAFIEPEDYLDMYIGGGVNYVGYLPEELVMLIFSKLDPLTLCRAASACRAFSVLSSDNQLWQKFCIGYASEKELLSNAQSDWKQYYRMSICRERKWQKIDTSPWRYQFHSQIEHLTISDDFEHIVIGLTDADVYQCFLILVNKSRRVPLFECTMDANEFVVATSFTKHHLVVFKGNEALMFTQETQECELSFYYQSSDVVPARITTGIVLEEEGHVLAALSNGAILLWEMPIETAIAGALKSKIQLRKPQSFLVQAHSNSISHLRKIRRGESESRFVSVDTVSSEFRIWTRAKNSNNPKEESSFASIFRKPKYICEKIVSLSGQLGQINRILFPHSAALLSNSPQEIRVWDLDRGDLSYSIPFSAECSVVQVNANEKFLLLTRRSGLTTSATGHLNVLESRNLQTGELRSSLLCSYSNCILDSESFSFAIECENAFNYIVFNIFTGKLIQLLPAHYDFGRIEMIRDSLVCIGQRSIAVWDLNKEAKNRSSSSNSSGEIHLNRYLSSIISKKGTGGDLEEVPSASSPTPSTSSPGLPREEKEANDETAQQSKRKLTEGLLIWAKSSAKMSSAVGSPCAAVSVSDSAAADLTPKSAPPKRSKTTKYFEPTRSFSATSSASSASSPSQRKEDKEEKNK